MAARHAAGLEANPLRLLDLGLGSGADLENIRAALGQRTLELFGVDSYEPNVRASRDRGVNVVSLDIEREPLPFADASIDLVVANQILEHTKEIFWIVSETARVLKSEAPSWVCPTSRRFTAAPCFSSECSLLPSMCSAPTSGVS